MPTFTFLSPEWVDAAVAIRDDYAADAPADLPAIRLNLVVTEVPFGAGTAEASIDTSEGSTIPRLGTVADADATVTLDYRTAHALLIQRDPEAAMMAFMMGQIRVDGDLAKVLALQQLDAPNATRAVVAEAHDRVLAITAPLSSG